MQAKIEEIAKRKPDEFDYNGALEYFTSYFRSRALFGEID
jgi:hypothetical protein